MSSVLLFLLSSLKFSDSFIAPSIPNMEVEASTTAKFKEQHLQFWQLMIAGSVAGSVKHLTMFPVRTMSQRMLPRSYSQKHVGIQQTLRSIIQTEGPSALYRGIWSMRHGAMGPAHFVYFSFYEVSKKFLSAGNPNNSVAHAISGAFAAVWSYAVSTPVDMARLRLQNGFGNYKGVGDCVKRMIHEEGISRFYTFYRTGIRMNMYSSAVHFVTYEAAKRRLTEILPEKKGWWLVHATAGATAGGLVVALTWPLGVIERTLSQPTDPSKRIRVPYSRLFISTVKYEGFMALYRGCLPTMLLRAPATAICWSTYEAAKSIFLDLNGDLTTACK